ncbi:MAG: SMC-Scp complex subunit ScpB [Candidatus Bathyarchaeota archaeon]|nr:SMC-Scp complex subunit ScpB [Candidatus Bathyarchaeota archaeon]
MSKELTNYEKRLCRLEAALYSAGRPLSVDDMKSVAGTKSEKTVMKLVGQLTKRYIDRMGALEIMVHEDERVSLQLNEKYEAIVNQFNHKPLLKKGPLRTLSYVAFHQPVDQRQVVEDRGSHVYSHLRMMESMGLINRERSEERSYIITTTSFFGDYFGFSQTPMKSKLQLKQIFRELKIDKLENGSISSLFDDLEGDEGFLADPRNGLSHGLPQYSGSSHQGS